MNAQRWLQCVQVGVCAAALVVLAVHAAEQLNPESACLRRLNAEQLSVQTVLAITTGSAPRALSNAVPTAVTNAARAASSSNTAASATAPAARRSRGTRHRLIDLDGDGVADNREL